MCIYIHICISRGRQTERGTDRKNKTNVEKGEKDNGTMESGEQIAESREQRAQRAEAQLEREREREREREDIRIRM